MQNQMRNDLAELLAFESVQGSAGENAPFGRAMRETLDWFLAKAKGYGLQTGELGGYCGWAEYGDGAADVFGVLCHLDTVPAGDGNWSVPPYKLTEKDGVLYGRGIVDNKGPAVVMLHVLKRLKDENIKLKHRVRLIVGCNEETGSECIKHYVRHGETPRFSMVPDADFPVINSEKGILHLKISFPDEYCYTPIFIKFGSRPNVIPDMAIARVAKDSALARLLQDAERLQRWLTIVGIDPKDVTVRELDNCVEIETRGVAGHAMTPHKADNAAWKLFATLSILKNKDPSDLEIINELICSPLSKKRLGIDLSDKKSGELTLSLGIGKCDSLTKSEKQRAESPGFLDLTIDIRLPLCADKEKIVKAIKDKLKAFGCKPQTEILYYAPNLYIKPNSKLIKALLKVCRQTMGIKAKPVQTGGGTYARALPYAAAFGPAFPGIETNMHNADERIGAHEFDKLSDIYYAAVSELDKIEI